MELINLGLDSELAAYAACASGQRLARVTAVDRGRYVVRNERGELGVKSNRLTAQEKVFDSLRASLRAKSTKPVDVHHNSSDRQEK